MSKTILHQNMARSVIFFENLFYYDVAIVTHSAQLA